ncbi:hypothetical protein CR513_54356, partial [Mucuna pruriens]
MENYMDRKMKEKQGIPTEPFPFAPFSIYRTTFQQPSTFFSPPPKTWTLPTIGAYRTRTKLESSSRVSREKPTNPSLHNSPESSPERQRSSSQEKQAIPEKEYLQDAQDPYSQFTIKLRPTNESGYNSSSGSKENQSMTSSEASEEEGEYDQPKTSSKSSYEDKDDVNIKNILMADTTRSRERTEAIYDSEEEVISSPPQHGPQKPNNGPWFTLDDIPPNKWRSKLIEFGSDPYKVIEEFLCRITGTLKHWYHGLGTVRQDQLHNLGTAAVVLGVLHEEFIGDGAIIDKKVKQEYFEMKCCSIKIKDLNKHFQRMSQRFYILNGLNDPSLKNTYVASLPKEIQPELNRMVMAAQKDFSAMTMGEIHQMTQEDVDKLCRQHKYFSDIMNQKGKFRKACKKPYLEIKCKDKTCSCSSKKKKKEALPRKKRKKPFKFFRKKKFRGKPVLHLRQKGHYSRNYPNKTDKAIKLISSLKLDDEEVESLYSEQSFANEETVFALKESEHEDQSKTESIPIFSVEKLNTITISTPQPSIEVQLLPSKFHKPINVIAFMDTGAQKTMMNPEKFWKKEVCHFVAANRKIFKTDLITKDLVGIKFFPDCVVWTKVIGSKLPDRDILIGMDILSTGVRHKREFKPFTEVLKLFSLTESPTEIEEIKKKILSLCENSHEEFTDLNPIWKNHDFFIRLSFKLNEDGLIEPTQSNWACQAFYVEKISEKLQGKKRLVIDYKPLNHFLQDDKFPIPKASSLPFLIKESNIFSKFDLKSRFWQLGIDPSDRHKTAYCIPNAQYQWTVLPFGLKVAPSLFQKAMTRIFESLLEHAIIYIDDILLFSKDMKTHKVLLNQFFDIANHYGLMFSEKKIHLA